MRGMCFQSFYALMPLRILLAKSAKDNFQLAKMHSLKAGIPAAEERKVWGAHINYPIKCSCFLFRGEFNLGRVSERWIYFKIGILSCEFVPVIDG